MSGSVYTRRLLAVHLTPSAAADAVVPAGKVWILTHLVGVAASSGSQAVLGIYAPNPITVAVAVQAPNTIQVYAVETRIVLQAGEDLHVQAVAGDWNVTATGYEFNA